MTEQTTTSRRGLLTALLTLPAAALVIATAGPASAAGELNPSDREHFRFLQKDSEFAPQSQRTRTRALKDQAGTGGHAPNRGVFSRGHDRFGAHTFDRLRDKRSFTIGRGR